jgi:hypothetical protein
MKALYALMHHEANSPHALYDDPWAAALDLILHEEALDEDAATVVVAQTGQSIPMRRKGIVEALTDEAEPSNVSGKHFIVFRYDANNGRTKADVRPKDGGGTP